MTKRVISFINRFFYFFQLILIKLEVIHGSSLYINNHKSNPLNRKIKAKELPKNNTNKLTNR
jgi:hypothetical protein